MADVLVRGLEQDVLDRLEEKARRAGRSFDDLAREALMREVISAHGSVQTRAEILADLDRIRLSGPKVDDDSTILVRAARDSDDVGH